MIAERVHKPVARPSSPVSRSSDAAEHQAARIARQVVGMPMPQRNPVSRIQSPTSRANPMQRSDARAGQPLPPSVRRFMEPRFGADFGDVSLHADEHAAARSRELNAAAFTQGRDIFFGGGQYRPDERAGRELIAHELTHTLQQRGGRVASDFGTLDTVSPDLIQRATGRYEVAGIRLFRTRTGETVPLPSDMTFEDAERLEAEGLAAEQRLARKPKPAPLPPVRRPKATPPATAKKVPQKRRNRGPRRNAAAPPAAALDAALKEATGSGKVARDLARAGLPVLMRGVKHVQRLKRNEQTHDDATKKKEQSEAAVVMPPSDLQSRSNEAQVGLVAERPEPQVDPAVGKGRLGASLQENLPTSLEEVDNFKRESRAQRMSAEVALSIHADKSAVVANFGDLRHTPPAAPNDHVTKQLPLEEAAPPTPASDLGRGLVAPLLPEHTDLSRFPKQADQQLKAEGVTQEQLDMVDSGDLAQARQEKQQLALEATTQPQAMRDFAGAQASSVEQTLRVDATRERGAMRAQRRSGLGRTAKRQRDARDALEKKREEVGAEINRRYGLAQSSVQLKLAALETSSILRFDNGNKAAAQQFEDDVNRDLDAYKAERYSGFFGRLRRAKDWLLGMESLPGVKSIIDTRRATFVSTIELLVEAITADNKRVIEGCRAELKAARESIAGYVAGLEPKLQEIGSQAAGQIGERLDALDRSIDQREESLRQQLQEKQQSAIKAIDEKIEKMKEAMSGALAKLGKLLLWAAKKFFSWALSKFGYSLSDIESIINKGVAVLKAIFTGPIRFVKNLVSAAKLGFANFRDHFLTHLKNALFEWLTGSLSGIRLPAVWNARGILDLALQVLDLGPEAVKRRLLARLGGDTRLVARLEQNLPIVRRIFVEGPTAAWEQIKAQAADLETKLVDELRNFVFVEIAKRAAITIIAMFTPGAGIVRAIIGIYDTVVFFVQKARDIARMVGSFLGSIAEIAAGNIGAGAKALEDGLARALKLVIEFLARFLRLSGIPAKIKGVTQKVRGKVDQVVDRLLDWIVAQARRLGLAVKTGAQKVIKAFTRWWAARKEFKTEDGQTHALYFTGEEGNALLTLRSTPMAFSKFVEAAETLGDPTRVKAKKTAQIIATQIDDERRKPPTGKDEAAVEEARKRKATLVNELLDKLAPHTSLLFREALPPCVTAQYGGLSGAQFAVRMQIKPLTKKRLPKGEPPTDKSNVRFEHLNARRESPGGASLYVKGHLLSQNLGGPGGWHNLVPLSRKGNAQHETQAEAVVKRTVELSAIVEYHVDPKYGSRADAKRLLERIEKSRDPEPVKREKRAIVAAEDHVPVSLSIQAYILFGDLKQQSTIIKRVIDNPISRQYEDYFLATTPRPEPVNLSVDGWELIATVPGIGPVLAKRIVDRRDKSWSSYAQLAEKVGGISEKTLKVMEDANHIRLFSRKTTSE